MAEPEINLNESTASRKYWNIVIEKCDFRIYLDVQIPVLVTVTYIS